MSDHHSTQDAPGRCDIDGLRARLGGDTPLLASFVKLGDPVVLDVVAAAGFDLALLDLEHTHMSPREAFGQLAYGLAIGLPIIARIDEAQISEAGRLLEAGAVGIQLAGVQYRHQVDSLVAACRFPPQGSRGMSISHRTAGYGSLSPAQYMQSAAARPLVSIQAESEISGTELDALLTAPIDMVFAGPLDLSIALGVPGSYTAPVLLAALDAIAERAQAAGVAYAHHVVPGLDPDPRAALLSVGPDVAAMLSGLRVARSDLLTRIRPR